MISFETFEKCIKAIQYQDELDDKLTDLLVDKECTGWVKTSGTLIDAMISLLKESINDEYEYISWWLYDVDEDNRFVYQDIEENKQIRYNLNNLKDLYLYICGKYLEVKQDIVDKDDNVVQSEITLEELEMLLGYCSSTQENE